MNSPPKQRRSFERLLADFQGYLAAPNDAHRAGALRHASWNVGRFVDALARDVVRTRALLGLIQAVRASGGAGCQGAEEGLMEQVASLARQCCHAWAGEYEVVFPGRPPIREAEASRAQAGEVLRELCAFANGCFQFRRPRDAFGGRRRRLAFEILAAGVRALPAEPRWVDHAEAVVQHGRGAEFQGALWFIGALVPREDDTPFGDYVEDEFDALDRIDEWRLMHRRDRP